MATHSPYSAGSLFTGPTYTMVGRISKKGGEICRNAVREPGPAAPRLEMDCSGPVATLLGPCFAIPANMSYRGCWRFFCVGDSWSEPTGAEQGWTLKATLHDRSPPCFLINESASRLNHRLRLITSHEFMGGQAGLRLELRWVTCMQTMILGVRVCPSYRHRNGLLDVVKSICGCGHLSFELDVTQGRSLATAGQCFKPLAGP